MAVSKPVGAQAPPQDPAQLARVEYESAKKEFNLGNFEKALQHFETAYRLSGKPQLLFNIGYVNKQVFERTHNLESLSRAIERFEAYLVIAQTSTDPGVLAGKKNAQDALKESEEELLHEQTARAEGEEALKVGEILLSEGKLAESQAQLEKYRRRPGNERPGVVHAHLLEGALAAQRGDVARAADAFSAALSLDKGAALAAGASEKARQAFAMAQLRVGSEPQLAVVHAPPATLKPTSRVELHFALTGDPVHLARGIALHYRAGAGAFTSMPVATFSFDTVITLPRLFSATLLQGSRVEYYGEVLDADGAVLEHLGTSASPFRVEVRQLPTSIARKWWFWTAGSGVVAVIAGAAVGLSLGLNRPPPSTKVEINTGLQVR